MDSSTRTDAPALPHASFCPDGTARGDRRKLLPRRHSWTQKLKLRDAQGLGVTFYVSFGEDEAGRLAEVWIEAAKEGTFTRGILGALGRVASVALQCGTPPQEVVKALRGLNFPPNGRVQVAGEGGDDAPRSPVGTCTSVVDWIAQEIECTYLGSKVPEVCPTNPI
jgi:hypothetical protein